MSTVAWITVRGLFGRRRFLFLLPLPVLLVGLAVLSRWASIPPVEWAPTVLTGLGLAVVLPIVALVVGTGVLGSEIDDGTVAHLLTKPLPRWQIVLPKLLVAAVVTAVTVALPMAAVGLLADGPRLAGAVAAASAAGALVYTALFLMLSLITRRPVLLGLVYVLIWEGLLGNIVRGTAVLSVQQYVVALADRLAPTALLDGRVSMSVVIALSAIITVGSTLLAVDRLRSFSLAGETG